MKRYSQVVLGVCVLAALMLAGPGSGAMKEKKEGMDHGSAPRLSMLRGAHVQKFLAQFDTNKDKKISMDEWHAGWGAILKQADTDVDGSLSKAEAKAYSDAQKKSMLDDMNAMFKKADTNGDGAVSKDEFKGGPEMFKMADANGDGKITADEADAAHKKMIGMHASDHDPSAAWEKVDANKDGKISLDELNNWAHALFGAWDKNKDGFLSADDFKPSAPEKSKKDDKGKDSHSHESPGGY